MASHLASKYLQLPDGSEDFGKPSPLAMLAATCKKIGVASPRKATRRVVRTRSPQPVASRTLSPQPATTSLFETPIPAMSCHQPPPTPPPSPPSAVTTPLAPGFQSVDSMSLPYSGGALQCRQPYCAVYQPSTPCYTPYTMVVPPKSQYVPAVDYMNSYCYSPRYLPRRVLYHPYHPHALTSQISSSLVFGVYPHHMSASVSSPSSLKVRSRRDHRNHWQVVNQLDRVIDDERIEEEIIEVLSLWSYNDSKFDYILVLLLHVASLCYLYI